MSDPIIGIVDDDPAFLRALRRLLTGEGFAVRSFPSAAAFLETLGESNLDCLVLDVSMPDVSGLDLQEKLNASNHPLPIVFLSGAGDIPMTVRAMKSGAQNFLTKPVNDAELLSAIQAAVALSAGRRAEGARLSGLRERLASLTPRECEVMTHVITGKLNKQIAADLGTGEQTIKVHRMRLMEKLAVHSVAELVRLAADLGIAPAN